MLATIGDKVNYPPVTLFGPVLRELGAWLGPEGSSDCPQFQVGWEASVLYLERIQQGDVKGCPLVGFVPICSGQPM